MREQKLLTALLVSLTAHAALLVFVPALLTRPASTLKRPLWVDLVDLKEPTRAALSLPRPASFGAPPPQKTEMEPAARTAPARRATDTRSRREPSPAPPLRQPHPLPSSRDLLPTMNSLLAHNRAYDAPLSLESSQDDDGPRHHGPQYEAYLRDIKEAVRKNWKVSGEGESKRGTTVLRISIKQDGSLASLDLLESCGMILHDYEALEAIKQSFPLRPPPESLLDEHGKLSIRFSFHYFLAPPA